MFFNVMFFRRYAKSKLYYTKSNNFTPQQKREVKTSQGCILFFK
jgi:hypothetical protein